MVDLGPAGAVRVRQEHVVPCLCPVSAEEPGHPPFAQQAAQPAPLRSPGGECQREAEDEQDGIEVGELQLGERTSGRCRPIQHGLRQAAAAVDLHAWIDPG